MVKEHGEGKGWKAVILEQPQGSGQVQEHQVVQQVEAEQQQN